MYIRQKPYIYHYGDLRLSVCYDLIHAYMYIMKTTNHICKNKKKKKKKAISPVHRSCISVTFVASDHWVFDHESVALSAVLVAADTLLSAADTHLSTAPPTPSSLSALHSTPERQSTQPIESSPDEGRTAPTGCRPSDQVKQLLPSICLYARAFRFRKKYSDSIFQNESIQHITAVWAYRLLAFTMLSNVNSTPSSWVTLTTSQRRRLWRQL